MTCSIMHHIFSSSHTCIVQLRMGMNLKEGCVIVVVLSCIFFVGRVETRDYLFDRGICTGLGDRVGTMLTLAALARIEGATVVFQWCNFHKGIFSQIRSHIPRWHGYNYSMVEFKSRFSLPAEIILVESITAQHRTLPLVQWTDVGVPAEDGSDSVYTIAWKTTRLGRAQLSAREFKESYQTVAGFFAASVAMEGQVYVAVHLRGPDNNTYYGDMDNLSLYCTGKVLKQLMALNVSLVAISNNVPWANELLGGRLRVSDGRSAYDDFSLLLGASGVVQHAWGGWSSYSHVPALASGIPLISTFRGSRHRHDLFRAQGGLPREIYSCENRRDYVKAVAASVVRRFGRNYRSRRV